MPSPPLLHAAMHWPSIWRFCWASGSPEEKLPVLFWIYGGAFSGGSGADAEFDGDALNNLGAVVVTSNYRCGALGFFSTPELRKKGLGGNLGLLDQIAALRWVHENIGAFGGDPDCVTVFGQSAGGISTRMLLCTDLTEGLMHRAIIESGGGLIEADLVRTREDFERICQGAMEHLGWTTEDLFTRRAGEIIVGLSQAAREISTEFEVAYFQPFVDGTAVPEVPGIRIAEGKYKDIPIINATVAGDFWMFSRKVREYVDGDDLYGRAFSYAASISWAQQNVEQHRRPIYAFYLDRAQPPENGPGWATHGPPRFGAQTMHSSEIAYVFGTLEARKRDYQPYDQQLSEWMGRYWVNFARTGDPNGAELPAWPAYTGDNPVAMHFGDDIHAAENLVQSPEEQRVMDYIKRCPGMLTTFESTGGTK